MTEDDIRQHLNAVWDNDTHYDVVVSHTPVRSILDLADNKQKHVGIISYLDRFNKAVGHGTQPTAWICGHIHERYGVVEQDNCTFYNVAMCNRKYVHANPPMEFEL